MKIRAKKLRKSSLFKLIFISSAIPFGLFFLLCGVAAVFGAETVTWYDKPVTGIKGLFVALLLYPFFIAFLSCFTWIGAAVGLWAYSWFSEIELEFVDGRIIESERIEADSPDNAG